MAIKLPAGTKISTNTDKGLMTAYLTLPYSGGFDVALHYHSDDTWSGINWCPYLVLYADISPWNSLAVAEDVFGSIGHKPAQEA